MGETETHITSYQQVGAMSVGLFVPVPSASLARYLRPPFPISRSRLECERCSLLELIWRVRVFLLRWRCMLRNLRMLYAFAGALPRPTLISRPVRTSRVTCNTIRRLQIKY